MFLRNLDGMRDSFDFVAVCFTETAIFCMVAWGATFVGVGTAISSDSSNHSPSSPSSAETCDTLIACVPQNLLGVILSVETR